jgi:hypothetical protein
MAGKLGKGQKSLIWITVVIVVIAGAVGYISWSQEKAISAKLEEARAAGYPLKAEDLEQFLDNKTGTNAAPIYGELNDRLESLTFTNKDLGESLVSYGSAAFSEEEWDEIELFLNECKPVLDDLEAGSRTDYCYYEKNWSLGFNVTVPEMAGLKTATKYMCDRVRLKLHRGDVEGAIEDFETLSRFTAHVREQPMMIGLLVSIASDSIVSRMVETELPRAVEDIRLRAAFRNYFDQLPESWDLSRSNYPEAFSGIWVIDNVLKRHRWEELGGTGMSDNILVDALMETSIGINASTIATLDVWMPAIRNYRPGDDEREFYEQLVSRISVASEQSVFAEEFLSFMTPMYQSVWKSVYRAKARRRMGLAAIDAIEFHADNGSWPESLPEEYIDPFSDKALMYRVNGDGFRVWSVAEDGSDDRGMARHESPQAFDEVLIYPRVLTPFENPNAVAATPTAPKGEGVGLP